MRRDDAADQVLALAEPIADGLGLTVVDVSLRSGGRQRVLTVTVDKDGGVTLDDCQQMSRALGDALDARGLVDGPYRLEVESPGIDRVLKSERELRHFTGRQVELTTYGPHDGRRRFVGTLAGYEDGVLVIDEEGAGPRRFARDEVARIRLHVRF